MPTLEQQAELRKQIAENIKNGCESSVTVKYLGKLDSVRKQEWDEFSIAVGNHIENYTVSQYGDKGDDLASEYSAQSCLDQVKKYLQRQGKNKRPGQDKLDLLKMAHYIQMAYDLTD